MRKMLFPSGGNVFTCKLLISSSSFPPSPTPGGGFRVICLKTEIQTPYSQLATKLIDSCMQHPMSVLMSWNKETKEKRTWKYRVSPQFFLEKVWPLLRRRWTQLVSKARLFSNFSVPFFFFLFPFFSKMRHEKVGERRVSVKIGFF